MTPIRHSAPCERPTVAQLVAQAEPAIRAEARKAHRRCGGRVPVEDLEQEGRMIAVRYAPRWRPDGGAPWIPYVMRMIRLTITRLSLIDRQITGARDRRSGHVIVVDTVSLDAPSGDSSGSTVGDLLAPSRPGHHEEAADRLIALGALREIYSEAQAGDVAAWVIARVCWGGDSYSQIARDLGVTSQAVRARAIRAYEYAAAVEAGSWSGCPACGAPPGAMAFCGACWADLDARMGRVG